jgi:phosphomannomutase
VSSLKFGTSGLRGLVTDLVGGPSQTYTAAFLEHLSESGRPARAILIGSDLRSSSPRIAGDCAQAARQLGVEAIHCGEVPTPALAAEARRRGLPAIMVTGSHIPEDRNGLKFYSAQGEITKEDEAGIQAARAALSFDEQPDASGDGSWTEDAHEATVLAYRSRNVDFFGRGSLRGLSVGVFEHSSVGRDLLADVLTDLGASVTRLGRADRFVAVDTEAHSPENRAAIREWASRNQFDAVVSMDGDADRPLVADEQGTIVSGDILGLVAARFLGASVVVTPVTSSSSIERIMQPSGATVVRTRVGSPYVLAAMESCASDRGPIVGFEANGGVLLGSDISRSHRPLAALPTRDAFLPILVALSEIQVRQTALSRIVADLRVGFTAAGRLQDVAAERSTPFLEGLHQVEFRSAFFKDLPAIADFNVLDGVRVQFVDGSVVHFRASGNAPELRCYIEAGTRAEADALLDKSLAAAAKALAR